MITLEVLKGTARTNGWSKSYSTTLRSGLLLLLLTIGALARAASPATKLEMQSFPVLKLTGEVGTTNQLQYLTDMGQTNAWNVLTNIILTNNPQFFVDASATGWVKRFYQTVVVGETITNIPSGMALIPAGAFTMGDSLDGDGAALPQHNVYVSAFYMDKTLVTKALWDEVYNWAIQHNYSFDHPGLGKAANHPVHTINWYDVVKWCNARSEKEGRVCAYYTSAAQTTVYRTGQLAVQNDWVKWNTGFRLPTEAEWEKAARGGLSGKRFPWGDTISHSQANYASYSGYSYDISPTRGFHPKYNDGVYPYTSPVGSFSANGYGLYDMSGNLWEWCWDWDGSYSSGSQNDPRGPASGSNRVFRGGNWNYSARGCRVAGRGNRWPDYGYYGLGFRSVLPPGQ